MMNLQHFFALLLSCNFMTLLSSEKLLGKSAPLFTGQALFPDGSEKNLNLEDYKGHNLVLYFYPLDNSPYCTLQAQSFKKNFYKFQEQDIIIIGISPDSLQSHLQFHCSLNLPYTLVADKHPKNAIAKLYGAKGFLFTRRKTFLINKQGIIFKIFSQINIETQIADILQAFEKENNKLNKQE